MRLLSSFSKKSSNRLVMSPVGSHLEAKRCQSLGCSTLSLLRMVKALCFCLGVQRAHFVLSPSGRMPVSIKKCIMQTN